MKQGVCSSHVNTFKKRLEARGAAPACRAGVQRHQPGLQPAHSCSTWKPQQTGLDGWGENWSEAKQASQGWEVRGFQTITHICSPASVPGSSLSVYLFPLPFINIVSLASPDPRASQKRQCVRDLISQTIPRRSSVLGCASVHILDWTHSKIKRTVRRRTTKPLAKDGLQRFARGLFRKQCHRTDGGKEDC